MSRQIVTILAALLCLTLVACDSAGESIPESTPAAATANPGPETTPEPTGESEGEDRLIETDYGSYTLPGGWYEFDQISTPQKPFYLKEGISTESAISNISVEMGTNFYTAEDHLEFREAILQQLGTQAAGLNAQVQASGRSTAAGDILYVFTLSTDDASTIQYYIVGDFRYVLIHVTDMYDERISEVNDVAAAIADSFTWAEEQ